jgi:hypothetical protein
MSCGLKSEWRDKHIDLSATPMEILALRWNPGNYSDGNTKSLRRKITPHNTSQITPHRAVGKLQRKQGVFGGDLYSDSEW